MEEKMVKPLSGGQAVAYAMRQINPEVMAAYPITPQTPIIEQYAEYVADGLVDTEFIMAESEHSALAACFGAAAAGGRAMTATASMGLALMWEVVASSAGTRLPIVMAVGNRALSSPLNIHCDHSDSMGTRDLSWIQIFAENAQEAYENIFLALKIAEKVYLPVMAMQDGFFTTHNVEGVKVLPDKEVKKFVGEYKPKKPLLDTDNPVTVGPVELQNYFTETKWQQNQAMKEALGVYLSVGKELEKLTGREYPYFEEYKSEDAEALIVVLSSTAGTTKDVVDEMREEGKKVGLLKPILFRPFPMKEIAKALENKKRVAVLDRSESYGSFPPLFSEIRSALFESEKRPELWSYVFGLGGRDISKIEIRKVFDDLLEGNKPEEQINYIGLRK